MTPEERQALREKHRNEDGNCAECCVEIVDLWQTDHFSTKYPCDVIRVLDVLDRIARWANSVEKLADPRSGLSAQDIIGRINDLLNVTPQPLIEPKVIKDCHHAGTYRGFFQDERPIYCPKCGEKL